jgi:pimeloyl-ACP methyl ester carboxylesterase
VPLLALYGGSDAIVKPAQALRVRDALPSGATFRLVPGASHLTLFLRPDIQQAIAAWFQKTMAEPREQIGRDSSGRALTR